MKKQNNVNLANPGTRLEKSRAFPASRQCPDENYTTIEEEQVEHPGTAVPDSW